MKILFLPKAPDATAYYRVDLPATALKALGHDVAVRFLEPTPGLPAHGIREAEVEWADVVVVQRAMTKYALDTIRQIKEKLPQKLIVGDYDDDYFSVPDWNPGYTQIKANEVHWRALIREMDGIIVSTDPLAAAIEQRYDGPIEVIANGFDFETFDKLPTPPPFPLVAPLLIDGKLVPQYTVTNEQFNDLMRDRTVVAYAGSQFHYADLDWFASEVKLIMKRLPDVVLLFIGYLQHNVLRDAELSRIFTFPGRFPPTAFYAALKALKMDAMLAPLDPCEFNESKCVGPDTIVMTPAGASRIANLVPQRVDDRVTTASGEVLTSDGMRRYDGAYYGARQRCLKITTEWGYQIVGTPTHRLMVGGAWKAMKDVCVGDVLKLEPVKWPSLKQVEVAYPLFMHKLYSQKSLETFSEQNAPRIRINEDWGRFLGYLIGDGTINGYNTVGISCSTDYPDVEADVCRLMSSFGLVPLVVAKFDKRRAKLSKGRDVKASSRVFRRLLEHMGFAGSKGKLLVVPDVIMRSPIGVVREFLRGLFESDSGAITKSCGVTFCTKSEMLARQTQFLLSAFGIKAGVKIRMCRSQDWKSKRPYFYVEIRSKSARIFHTKIGFVSSAKNAILSDRKSRARSNAFIDWTWNDAVVSIEEVESEVFDLSVPQTRHYIASNFMSHNSNLKVMEAMALGAMPIVSKLDPYQDDLDPDDYLHSDKSSIAGAEDERAFAVERHGALIPYKKKPGTWTDAIEEIVEAKKDPDDAAELARFRLNNDAYVRQTHDIKLRAPLYVDFFTRLLQEKAR